LAVAGDGSIVYLISSDGWKIVREVTFSSKVNALSFSRNDERLAVGTSDGVMSLLDSQHDWGLAGEHDSKESPVLALDWSSNGSHFAVGREDGIVSIHESKSVLANFFVPQKELTRGGALVYTLAFGSAGNFLAVGGGDWKIAVYSSRGGWALVHEIKLGGWISSVRWSNNAKYLAFGGKDPAKGGRVVDTNSWDPIEELAKNESPKSGVGIGEELCSLCWSNDDRFVAFGGSTGNTRIVDVSSWEVVYLMDHEGKIKNLQKFTIPKLRNTDTDDDFSIASGYTNKTSDSSKRNDKRSFLASTAKSILHDLAVADSLKKPKNGMGEPGVYDWERLPIVMEFIESSEEFLDLYKIEEPPKRIRLYVKCITMLEQHVQWITHMVMKKDAHRRALAMDDGEPISALLNVLVVSTKVMKGALVAEKHDMTWWESASDFSLTTRDIRRINAWNEEWRKASSGDAIIVDIGMLTLSDQMK